MNTETPIAADAHLAAAAAAFVASMQQIYGEQWPQFRQELLRFADVQTSGLTWDTSYADITLQEGDARAVPLIEGGHAIVSILGGDEIDSAIQDQLHQRHDNNDLMEGTPSLSLMLGNVRQFLNWREAYNLGVSLIRVVDTARVG